MASATKDARLELRITRGHKTLLERAAALTGSTTSQFIAMHALAAANEVLVRERVIRLTQRDMEQFARALEGKAPAPTPAARKAADRYGRGRIVGDRYEWSSSD